MSSLSHLQATQIFDSRGNPTVRVTAQMGEHTAVADVPSGASTGSFEAKELRDGDKTHFQGKGVMHAVSNVNDIIAPALIGGSFTSIESADQIMMTLDGTNDKSRLGANAILGVSITIARLLAMREHLPLHRYLQGLSPLFAPPSASFNHPQLLVNLINGGAHAVGSTSVQEFHIMPRTGSLPHDLALIHQFQTTLHNELVRRGQMSGIGDEGGYVVSHYTTSEALTLLHDIKASLHLGGSVVFGMDIAAESFYRAGKYHIDGQELHTSRYMDFLKDLTKRFQIALIEDPFPENDFESFAELKRSSPETLIIGDDLTVTNPKRLQAAHANKSISGLIVKPNQIGSISETLDVLCFAKQNHLHAIASHRSGETNDAFIVDLALGTGCYGMKIGAFQRGERIAKYNHLIELMNQK